MDDLKDEADSNMTNALTRYKELAFVLQLWEILFLELGIS